MPDDPNVYFDTWLNRMIAKHGADKAPDEILAHLAITMLSMCASRENPKGFVYTFDGIGRVEAKLDTDAIGNKGWRVFEEEKPDA